MLLIWDAMADHLRENLRAGRSVNVPQFGMFTFEPLISDDPFGGKTKVTLRPCFIINSDLREALYRYPGKEEIRTSGPKGSSVYQQGRKVIYLNEVPIAAGCYYKQDVIRSALKALFMGIGDLIKRNYNLCLKFNGVTISILKRNLHVKFDKELTEKVQETTIRQKPQLLSDTWRRAKLSDAMMNFIKRPNSPDVVAVRNRTKNLSILSLDMNSCVRPEMPKSARPASRGATPRGRRPSSRGGPPADLPPRPATSC